MHVMNRVIYTSFMHVMNKVIFISCMHVMILLTVKAELFCYKYAIALELI